MELCSVALAEHWPRHLCLRVQSRWPPEGALWIEPQLAARRQGCRGGRWEEVLGGELFLEAWKAMKEGTAPGGGAPGLPRRGKAAHRLPHGRGHATGRLALRLLARLPASVSQARGLRHVPL